MKFLRISPMFGPDESQSPLKTGMDELGVAGILHS